MEGVRRRASVDVKEFADVVVCRAREASVQTPSPNMIWHFSKQTRANIPSLRGRHITMPRGPEVV